MTAVLRRVRAAFGAALFATAAAGCGGGNAVPPPAVVRPVPSGAHSLAFGGVALAGAAPGAPANVGTMSVTAAVRLRDAAGLAAYGAAAADPVSPLYRRFLTPQQIADRFGASPADYAAAAAYLRGFGLAVATWPQRLALSVTGRQSAIEAAFHTHFVTYATPSGIVYGPREAPAVGAGVPIVAASRLVDGAGRLFRQSIAVSGGSGQNVQLGYAPQQIAAAFDYTGAYNAGFTGASINVGIIGTGPIDMRDFAAYKAHFGYAGSGAIVQVNAGSAAAAAAGKSPTATPPPVTAPCSGALPGCNPEDGEAQIDVEQVNGLAPDANVFFYLAYVPDECNGAAPPCPAADFGPQLGLSEYEIELQQAIADDTADVLSLSFAGGERGNTALFLDANGAYDPGGIGPSMFAALAAEGIAVFVSSGDAGAQGCARPVISGFVDSQCVSYPGSDVSVTSVGGVTTPLDNAGRFVGPVTGWGQQTTGGAAASGGGISAFIPAPSWQSGPGVPASHRTQPDVALEGDALTGVAVIGNTPGLIRPFGGTSVAAPEMAAMWALALGACKQTAACTARGSGAHPWRLGNAAPALYGIYNSSRYASTFLDVSFGNNGVIGCSQGAGCPSPRPTPDPGFSAGAGYDNVTGIGVPFARHLIRAVVGV